MSVEQTDENNSTSAPLGPQVTLSDIQDVDFESVISDSSTSDCYQLSKCFREAANLHINLDQESAMPAARVYAMMADITGLCTQFDNPSSPYRPMIEMEGRRSATPEDYVGSPVPALAYAAENANHPALKARLSDVCWLIDRKRHPIRLLAIEAYSQVAISLESGELKDQSETLKPAAGLTSRDAMKRALTIGRSLPIDNPEQQRAKAVFSKCKDIALDSGEPVSVLWFCEMDLNFGVSETGNLAGEIETFLENHNQEDKLHITIDLWRLAAQAWHRAKNNEKRYHCRIQAADLLVQHADKQPTAMQSAHWLSQAISEYHGVPDTKERRAELKHKLVDVQAKIPDEMSPFTQTIDLEDIRSATSEQFENLENLRDALLMFAQISVSSDPETLSKEAIKSIQNHPLSSLFGVSVHDHEGKTKFKTSGGGVGDGGDLSAIKMQVATHEDIHRRILVHGQIRPAMQLISDQFMIASETLYRLMIQSPFVPTNLTMTFSIGFERFFAADFTSALYILTPLLENSLRHLLKLHGSDVTSFNDATQTQQDQTITVLFDQKRDELVEVFGRAIVEDIERVFLDKSGPALRHEVAHGLLHDGSPYGHDAIYACWLIFRLCCIPLFQNHTEIDLGI